MSSSEGAKGTDSAFERVSQLYYELGHYLQLDTMSQYDRTGTRETTGNKSTSSAANPITKSDAPPRKQTSSKDKTTKVVDEEGQSMDTATAGIINSQEISKQSAPVQASGEVGSSEAQGAKVTNSVHKRMPQLHNELYHFEQLGTVYDRIGTHETVCNKIGNYETVATHPILRADAPMQEETSSKGETSKPASRVDEEGQNTDTTAAGVYRSPEISNRSPAVQTRGEMGGCEDEMTPHYEQLGNVYDRMGTYETVGNVYK